VGAFVADPPLPGGGVKVGLFPLSHEARASTAKANNARSALTFRGITLSFDRFMAIQPDGRAQRSVRASAQPQQKLRAKVPAQAEPRCLPYRSSEPRSLQHRWSARPSRSQSLWLDRLL